MPRITSAVAELLLVPGANGGERTSKGGWGVGRPSGSDKMVASGTASSHSSGFLDAAPKCKFKTRFSGVKPKFFRQIFDNEFDPINITRLYNGVFISRAQSKYIDLGKNFEVKMKDEDAAESNKKGMAVMIRCLGAYCQIRLHFTPDEKKCLLLAAFQRYVDHLCKIYSTSGSQ